MSDSANFLKFSFAWGLRAPDLCITLNRLEGYTRVQGTGLPQTYNHLVQG